MYNIIGDTWQYDRKARCELSCDLSADGGSVNMDCQEVWHHDKLETIVTQMGFLTFML